MDIHDGTPELHRLVAALALGLGLGACQDKPPESISGAVNNARVAGQPASTAGTAEEKKLQKVQENDGAKHAAAAATTLAARVKAALGADPALGALAVDVSASGNAVTLVGTADNAANRDKASLIALAVQGVNSVENRMVIVRGS